jgi:hypothetical protein
VAAEWQAALSAGCICTMQFINIHCHALTKDIHSTDPRARLPGIRSKVAFAAWQIATKWLDDRVAVLNARNFNVFYYNWLWIVA